MTDTQQHPEQSSSGRTRTYAGFEFDITSLETAGIVQLRIEQGAIALALLLSAGEAIEIGQRLHDAANVVEMAEGSSS